MGKKKRKDGPQPEESGHPRPTLPAPVSRIRFRGGSITDAINDNIHLESVDGLDMSFEGVEIGRAGRHNVYVGDPVREFIERLGLPQSTTTGEVREMLFTLREHSGSTHQETTAAVGKTALGQILASQGVQLVNFTASVASLLSTPAGQMLAAKLLGS